MAWRPARSLTVLHAQLKAGSRAAPPATDVYAWGLVGDAAHDPTSDHAPHDFPGWGQQIVTAADFPNAPALGLDARRVLDDIRKSKDPRVKYGISNGQMFSSYGVTKNGVYIPPWTWRDYGGSDKHFTHGHLSVVGDSRADGTQPWVTIGESSMGDFDPFGKPPNNPREIGVYAADVWGQEMLGTSPYGAGSPSPRTQLLGRLEAKLDAMLKAQGMAQADIDELQARPVLDVAAFVTMLAPALAPVLADLLSGLGAEVSAETVVAALTSEQGQVALTQAATAGANAAEDS